MHLKKRINLIVACQHDGGIGKDGKISWKSSVDLQHFKKITSGTPSGSGSIQNAVIMGRKTAESIGKSLPNRINYIVSSSTMSTMSTSTGTSTFYCPNIQDALVSACDNENVNKIFIIGGAQIYNVILRDYLHCIDTVYVTFVNTAFLCDTFIDIQTIKNMNLISQLEAMDPLMAEDELYLNFTTWRPKNAGEDEYLGLLKRILDNGELKQNRTGIDTLSLFGEKMTFDISDSIPVLTTKKFAWKTMLIELLWFVSGKTNNKLLTDQNVHIWDGNSTREYLDSIGLVSRKEGDLGPIYGFNWRHFGAEYTDCDADYTGKGVDQLAQIVKQLKYDRNNRRILLTSWNPAVQHLMALPACHVMAQWYVRQDKYLDCQLYQRSGDVALGVPFNIASYSVLTYMLAMVSGLAPGKFIHILGDAHIYTNHVEAVKEQVKRIPFAFPKLSFKRRIENIDDFVLSDFILTDYNCHPAIKMEMAL